jgi:hypothetical protein
MGGWMAGLRTDVEGVPNLPKEFCIFQDRPDPLWRQTAPQTHPCKKKGIRYEFKT